MAGVERILLLGKQGVGKTYQILKTADWLWQTGARFWVLDTDDSYPRSLEEFPGLGCTCAKVNGKQLHQVSGGIVHATFAYDWSEYVDWLDATLKTASAGKDWLVVDRISKAWDRVQNYVNEEVYGMTLAERLLAARKQIKDKKAMVVSANDRADWQVVNSQYNGWFLQVMYASRCNVLLTSSATGIRENDDAMTKEIFGPLGVKPAGQKDVGHEPHSVFLLTWNGQKAWHITTIKDRGGRKYFDKTPLASFPVQYLSAVAGMSRQVEQPVS